VENYLNECKKRERKKENEKREKRCKKYKKKQPKRKKKQYWLAFILKRIKISILTLNKL